MSPGGLSTVDDLRKVPKDGRVYELVDGVIVVTPAGMRHSEVAVRVTTTLANFVWPRGLGEVYSENAGIRLPNGNVRSPDGCFVRTEKLPGGRSPEDYGALVPDLTVEVLSPHDNLRDLLSKVHEYLACGVPLVWVVDPDRRSVTSYRSTTDVVEQAVGETLRAEPVLPGFSCEVAAFFSAVKETLQSSAASALGHRMHEVAEVEKWANPDGRARRVESDVRSYSATRP